MTRDALAVERERYVRQLETLLRQCLEYFKFHEHQELELQSEIEEVLK